MVVFTLLGNRFLLTNRTKSGNASKEFNNFPVRITFLERRKPSTNSQSLPKDIVQCVLCVSYSSHF